MERVVTRFAPSPTGYLHLGGARTALFNWLFARHHNGSFLLRIEDTDSARSSKEVATSIIQDMAWLGLHHDGDIVTQSSRMARHAEIAHHLVLKNKAYYCYCSEEEIAKQRDKCAEAGTYYKHICPWKNTKQTGSTPGVIRLMCPEDCKIEFLDGVYGQISVSSTEIEDMVILRSNGTPTYLLAVVVDDHDMNVTHIIRGSDHITNTTRQIILFSALGWSIPQFFHIPLIHDEDGSKLSKRTGATGISEYKKRGFLPDALCNYLLRMGWSYRDKEIVSMAEAVELFSMKNVGVSRSCLDDKKLLFLNHHYMNNMATADLLTALQPFMEEALGTSLSTEKLERLSAGIKGIAERSKTLQELADTALFYVQDIQITVTDDANVFIQDSTALVSALVNSFSAVPYYDWKKDTLTATIKEFAATNSVEASKIYKLLRAVITGKIVAPNITEVMTILGKDECVARLAFYAK